MSAARNYANAAMPRRRRLLAWLLTDHVGQGLAMLVAFTGGVLLLTKNRLADWAEQRFTKYPDAP